MTCTHTDRPNVLSLPSMGDPHMCRECWDASGGISAFKGKREAWDHDSYDYTVRNGEATYRDFRGVHYTNSSEDERVWK